MCSSRFSPCLALTVNRLNINANDQLINAQGVIYDLCYIIEFDSTSRSIVNVYLQEGLFDFILKIRCSKLCVFFS